MRFLDLFGMSLNSLFKRKVRTILTVLGVVIGSISIVVMISLGIGLKSAMMEEMSQYSDMTKIEVRTNGYWGGSSDNEEEKRLDEALVRTFESMEHVEAACPQLQTNALLKWKKYEANIELYGMSQEEIARKNIEVAKGTLPTPGSELELFFGNSVLLYFYDTKDYSMPYFDNGAPIEVDLMNDTVQLILDMENYNNNGTITDGTVKKAKKHTLKTAGIMAGEIDEYKSELSYAAFCDIDTLENALRKEFKGRVIPGQPLDKKGKPYKELYYSVINVYVDEMANVQGVQDMISEMGYQAYSEASWLQSAMNELNIIELVLGGIGAVSLFVAAIGIANTMMMSIYERTKEIGVMKVLGCRIRDIQFMFLTEAGLIGLFGGMLGLGISYGISVVINKIVSGSDMGYSYISVIPPWLAVVSLVFSTIIGMLAGFFPSRRAMKLSPLAAIRNE